MDFSGKRIGFVPYGDLQHPWNLRNFVYYARNRGLQFEIAQRGEDYDILVLSPLADISVWSKYPRGKTKIIFFLVDSYLSIHKGNLKGAFRGLAKFLVREQKSLRLNYLKTLQDMCSRADAVVCTTLEQKLDIEKHCDNVHIILECHFKAVRQSKVDYNIGSRINLVWEGLPANLDGFSHIKDVLIHLRKKYPIFLHIITDLVHKKYLNRFGRTHMINEVEKIMGESSHLNNESMFYMYQWNLDTFSHIVSACDLAIIPINTDNPLGIGKPENKLLLFWRMGMPTVVSSTPAYSRAMDACGLDSYCKNNNEWAEKLEKMIVDEETRKIAGQTGKRHANNFYSENIYLKNWDGLFESIL